jgi:hypothetical protein
MESPAVKAPLTERPEGMGMIVTQTVEEGWVNLSVDLSLTLIANPEELECVLSEIGRVLKVRLMLTKREVL